MEVANWSGQRGYAVARHAESIADAARAGAPIVQIAGQFELPPMSVVSCLRKQGIRVTPSAIEAAEEADLGSRISSAEVRRAATEFENAVGAHLNAHAVQYYSEQDLRARGEQLTPDCLLVSPAVIDGPSGPVEVAWLDAKNYTAYGSKLTANSLLRQAKAYIEAYGPGAFVFHYGIAEHLELDSVPGLTLLDGSWLDGV